MYLLDTEKFVSLVKEYQIPKEIKRYTRQYNRYHQKTVKDFMSLDRAELVDLLAFCKALSEETMEHDLFWNNAAFARRNMKSVPPVKTGRRLL